MRKIIVSHALLKKNLDKFDDSLLQLKEDTVEFLASPHSSQKAEKQLAIVRAEEKKALRLLKICRKYKSLCNEQFKQAADELCKGANELHKDVLHIDERLTRDFEQRWKEEEKKENDQDMAPVYKLGFVFGLPVVALTIYEKTPVIKDSLKLICASALLGVGVAYNKSIRRAFRKASKAVNDNFTVYYMKQTASECKRKMFSPRRASRENATNNKLSME